MLTTNQPTKNQRLLAQSDDDDGVGIQNLKFRFFFLSLSQQRNELMGCFRCCCCCIAHHLRDDDDDGYYGNYVLSIFF